MKKQKYTFPEENCWNCQFYQKVGSLASETRYCHGFKRKKARRFRSNDPLIKAPKWCPRRISPPICRIYGFKDERSEYMEGLFRRDYDKDKYASPSPQHYAPRQEISLGLTAKRFYDEVQNHPLHEVLPPDADVKDGEIIEIDDGLKPYYFYVQSFGIVIPLRSFQMDKRK